MDGDVDAGCLGWCFCGGFVRDGLARMVCRWLSLGGACQEAK